MVKLRFRYVVEDVDRHGNARLYFRRKGHAKIRLPGLPGSEKFMAVYSAALASSEQQQPPRRQRAGKGSFGFVCRCYYASTTFKALDASTQAWRRRALDAICVKHGDKPVAQMSAKHVRMLRDEKADFPGAARNRLKALRALFRWAVEKDEAPHDPTIGVKAITYVTKGHHSWTLEEVEAYEQRHPLGTKARLAMAILLYTSWRNTERQRFADLGHRYR
jgi:integrase/recombinase XerD